MTITDQTQQLVTRWLDSTALRHRVISNNLANSDTPGFIRNDVSFNAELARATNGARAGIAVSEDQTNEPRQDGNNVQVDQELAELSENALMQQMAVQVLQAKMSMNKVAITGKS
ncbi:MAG: flagellar basal body protein [Planctomycetota bacterium]